MADNDLVLPKGVCQNFTPQQWRRTKCKLCFHDIIDHTKSLTKEESEELIKNCIKGEERDNISDKSHSRTFTDQDLSYSSQSNHTQGSSKGSSEQLDVEIEDHSISKDSDNEGDETDDTSTIVQRRRKKKLSYSLDKQDSMDGDDGSATPNRSVQKRRTRSYRKNSSNLLQLTAMMRSSNSSLCSFTSEMTDGYSDYDYDVRSVTDDTDDYAEMNDVIDELETIKPELKARVQNERRISRTKIFDLERELEGLQDFYRANEIAKDRQIKSFQREIEGLKLELSSVKAHENILALKYRLELEGKSTRVNDLEQQVESLQDEISKLTSMAPVSETLHDITSKELERARKRIVNLEEENRSTEERLKLAEDLQSNDREFLDVLRNQLGSMEGDLLSAQDSNRMLEDKIKMMETIQTEFLKEQDKNLKANKEVEGLRQKVKRRDRHIEDLEDDNVKLQQLKTELESQLAKKEYKVKKMERKVSDLQNEVTKCCKEIADLTGENKTLEQVRRLTDLKLKEKTESTSEVQNGENIFIHTLEDRLKYTESRVKELELENDNFSRQFREMYDNLIATEKQADIYKEQLKDAEAKTSRLRQENKHSEKKIEMLHRKLLKSEKEKKRAVTRQTSAELKLNRYEEEELRSTILNMSQTDAADDNEEDKGSRMLKLKLQSTEAKLSMIEGNKGYLEAKLMNLERKLVDKEQEIVRLNDSMERDSGAPSQDYDRFDVLERENIMLQTKLDDFVIENIEHKDIVKQLKENNAYLEMTIQNLNLKLDDCTHRLKEVEEANHKLGREAWKRNQSLSSTQGEVDASINELRSHNKLLQERMKHFDDVEELVEQLEIQVKKERAHAQWYADENDNLKIKIAKMADTIAKLEESKSDFERSIHQLSDKNKDLNDDVKRLEEKLEIYGHLFGKDSKLYSSLKRRSIQSERDEEKIIEKALSPLMEEIKEKDIQIRNLSKEVEEKQSTINSLTDEIDILEANLAAMVTEKIRKLHSAGDSSSEETGADLQSGSTESILSFEKYRRGSKTCESEKVEAKNTETKEEHSPPAKTFPPVQLSIKVDKEAVVSIDPTSSEDLTVSTEAFYEMLRKQEELMKEKDLNYYHNILDEGNDSPSLYRTIENAILDQYNDEDLPPPSSVQTLPNTDRNIKLEYRDGTTSNHAKFAENVMENKQLVDDMYEQLAALEDMVKTSTTSVAVSASTISRLSPTSSPVTTSPTELTSSPTSGTTTTTSSVPDTEVTSSEVSPTPPITCAIPANQRPRAVSITNIQLKTGRPKERVTISAPEKSPSESKRSSGNESNIIDLSGLDDLLAEVSKRNSGGHEARNKIIPPHPIVRRHSERLPSPPKPIMPSIRTTRRRIIKLGGLNRSDSFDSATSRKLYTASMNPSVCSISSQSSSSISGGTASPPSGARTPASLVDSNSSSSVASSASITSVIYVPPPSEKSECSSPSLRSDSTENLGASTTPPFRRPKLDVNKFLNSSSSTME